MRVVSLVMFIAVVVVAKPIEDDRPKFYDINEAPQLFEKFIKDYDRHYKDEADRQVHYDAFLNTLKYVNEENAKGHSYTLGITLFADETDEESAKMSGHGCLVEPEDESQ